MSEEVTIKQETQGCAENLKPGRSYSPNVEIRENDDVVWLWADLPGVNRDSVDARLENNVLRIEGNVRTGDYEDLTPVYTEYNVGSFRRSFQLATSIDPEGIKATMRNGVLELQLRKSAEAKPRQIPVSIQ